jgi:hypothetical protein
MASISATSAEVQDSQVCHSCEWKVTDFLLLTEDPKRLDKFVYSHSVLLKSVIRECRNPVKF